MKMKKRGWIITIAIATLVVGGGSAIAASAFSVNIDKQKAKEIALQEAPGTITEIDLERERGNVVYEVDITKEGSLEKVEVYINADTGKVLSTINDNDDDRKATPGNSTTPTATPSEAAVNATKNAITKEQAGDLALTVVKGEVLRVESDWDDGIQQYEVKIVTSNGVVEVDIAAVDGSILSIDYDNDNDNDNDNDEDDNEDD